MENKLKYPDINVKLIGEDGNAFAIMGLVTKGLKKAGIGVDEIKEYQEESMSGDYDNLLRVACEWVNVS